MDVLIIGGGPAGISTAIYAARGGLSVTVVNTRGGSLLKAKTIDNYYGLPIGTSGKSVYNAGIKHAETLGVSVIDGEVTAVSYGGDGFEIKSTAGMLQAKAVVLASGVGRKTPFGLHLDEFEGKGVSYCAVCDAFFFRKKNVAVLGNGQYALEEADVLSKVAESVTVLTNGQIPIECDFPVVAHKINALNSKDGRLASITFDNGETKDYDGLFVALGIAGSSALATKLGAVTDGDYIVVDNSGRTNVPNLYAAGDCTGGIKQIATAAAQGAAVGLELVKTLKK